VKAYCILSSLLSIRYYYFHYNLCVQFWGPGGALAFAPSHAEGVWDVHMGVVLHGFYGVWDLNTDVSEGCWSRTFVCHVFIALSLCSSSIAELQMNHKPIQSFLHYRLHQNEKPRHPIPSSSTPRKSIAWAWYWDRRPAARAIGVVCPHKCLVSKLCFGAHKKFLARYFIVIGIFCHLYICPITHAIRGGSTGGRGRGQGGAPNEKCAPHFGPAALDFHLSRPVISLIQLHIVPPPASQLELWPPLPPCG